MRLQSLFKYEKRYDTLKKRNEWYVIFDSFVVGVYPTKKKAIELGWKRFAFHYQDNSHFGKGLRTAFQKTLEQIKDGAYKNYINRYDKIFDRRHFVEYSQDNLLFWLLKNRDIRLCYTPGDIRDYPERYILIKE